MRPAQCDLTVTNHPVPTHQLTPPVAVTTATLHRTATPRHRAHRHGVSRRMQIPRSDLSHRPHRGLHDQPMILHRLQVPGETTHAHRLLTGRVRIVDRPRLHQPGRPPAITIRCASRPAVSTQLGTQRSPADLDDLGIDHPRPQSPHHPEPVPTQHTPHRPTVHATTLDVTLSAMARK